MRQPHKSGASAGRSPSASTVRARRVSVIIPVKNERRTLPSVLREASKLSSDIIVVCNGTTDGSDRIAESMGARVIRYNEPLGHDVGRAVGAAQAKHDILLFTDGDLVIPAKDLLPFTQAVRRGADVALNSYLGPYTHPVVVSKHALNAVLGRPDLRGASLTTVPHAISRRALKRIGTEHLAVPPKAQAMAVSQGLRIVSAHLVDVGRLNRFRRRPKGAAGMDELGRLIVGDHLEAVRWLITATDGRGKHTDLKRNRSVLR